MGQLFDGEWVTEKQFPADDDGHFTRGRTRFRDAVQADPDATHPAEAGRYHLYVSYACPWAHRTLITRALLGLEDVIDVTVVNPRMTDDGWHFGGEDGHGPDPLFGHPYLRDIYTQADPDISGRVTVPVLWDKQRGTIVNNESREIARMFDRAFRDLARPGAPELAPPELHEVIEAANDRIYPAINNGVYKCGFARSQEAYNEAVTALFAELDHWEEVLGSQRWVAGDRFSEADVCLFPTLARFDLVYYTHFKCNKQHLYEYPHLYEYARRILAMPGVEATCQWHDIKLHYFWSHPSINPHRIVPQGPRRGLGSSAPSPRS